MDEGLSRAVHTMFKRLFDEGLIYRAERIINWCPRCLTALSDIEVEHVDEDGELVSIRYGEGDDSIVVATTRPETMLGDTAVAVHPDDPRYAHLVGRTVELPLTGRRIPVIADPHVDPEFGTGAVKVTPAHDPNDFEIGRRHGLGQIAVIGEDGCITDEAPERFRGLTAMEAREAVVAELRDQGLIRREARYVHDVPFSQRSGERIEPLVSLQWFMAMDELAKPAIEVVDDANFGDSGSAYGSGAPKFAGERRVRFHPPSNARVYMDWMRNIRPWVISRQLWWGHRLPVWYRREETYVGVTAPDGEEWERDPDVLDTWFSSALWPFATLGWPSQTPELRAFYPTDVLVTARDIIFLWVARMIMMALEFTGEVPFADVHIHAIIQAPDGRRMSKSLGTGIDPLALIDGGPRPPVFTEGGSFPAYGADALRWGLLAMASSQDVRFSEERVAQGLQLTNKLWNAARLILLGVGDHARRAIAPGAIEGHARPAIVPAAIEDHGRSAIAPAAIEDRWILSRLERAKAEVTSRIDRYDLSHAALSLYDFVYGELCDWYLELVKPRLRAAEPEAAATLLHVLVETLALAQPIIPFVTEEIYSYVPGAEGLLAAGVECEVAPVDELAERSLGRMIEAVQALRAWRDFAEVKVGAVVPARLAAEGYEDTREQLARMARLSLTSDGSAPVTSVPIPGGAVEVLATPDLDLGAAERKRGAQRERLEREIERAARKLQNDGFVAKAPAEVVQAERDKLAQLHAELEALTAGGQPA
jgi:valyl-tRNA synthetase